MKNFNEFKQELQEKRFSDILKQFGRDKDWIDWCKKYNIPCEHTSEPENIFLQKKK